MAKKCNIVVNNDDVTVFMYEGIAVQIPSIHKANAKTIIIEENNGVYTVVDDKKVSLPKQPTVKAKEPAKKIEKKTTKKSSSPKEDVIVDNIAEQSET